MGALLKILCHCTNCWKIKLRLTGLELSKRRTPPPHEKTSILADAFLCEAIARLSPNFTENAITQNLYVCVIGLNVSHAAMPICGGFELEASIFADEMLKQRCWQARPFRSKSNCLPSARRRGTESSIVPDETIGGKNGLPVLHYIRGPGSESDDDDALFAAAAAEVQQRFIEHESKSQSTAQPSAVQQNENSIAGGDKSTASGSTGEILSLDDLFSAAASNTAVSAPAPAPAPGPALSPAPSPAPFDYFSATSNMPDSPLLESDNSIPHSLGMQAATGSRLNLHMPSGSSSAPPRGSPMQQEMWRQQQLAQQRYQQTLQQQMMQQSQAGRIDLAFGRRQ